MPDSHGRIGVRTGATLAAAWLVLGLGALLYARWRGIPDWVAIPVAAAFLIEFPFYLLAGLEFARSWFTDGAGIRFACLLAASSVAPYLAYSVGTGQFRWPLFGLLLMVAAAVSFWYLVLPVSGATDVLFLAFLAALVAFRVFDRIYLPPFPKLNVSILGHVMLIRSGVLSLFAFRGPPDARFRFLPDWRDWVCGARYFLALLPVVAAVYWWLGLVQLRPHPLNVLLAAGTFLGILWFTALSEEYFFRGILQGILERWTGSPIAGLVGTSMLFGCAHLGFRFHGMFPNWRFALVAGTAGLFYGAAWRRSRSVQASMVTHALTVTVWRVFLQ